MVASATLSFHTDILLLIDLQPKLLVAIHEGDRVLRRAKFLYEMALLLDVPVLASEQNPEKLGPLDAHFEGLRAQGLVLPKMEFSALADEGFRSAWSSTGRTQVIFAGVETHICVSLTAQDLLLAGGVSVVCPDAVGSRSNEAHKLGMERIRDAGCVPAHSESVAYEWLGSAAHPKFRDALAIVKKYA